MELNTIHLTDALNGLKSLPDESVDCIVTSPPYWQMREDGRLVRTVGFGTYTR